MLKVFHCQSQREKVALETKGWLLFSLNRKIQLILEYLEFSLVIIINLLNIVEPHILIQVYRNLIDAGMHFINIG